MYWTLLFYCGTMQQQAKLNTSIHMHTNTHRGTFIQHMFWGHTPKKKICTRTVNSTSLSVGTILLETWLKTVISIRASSEMRFLCYGALSILWDALSFTASWPPEYCISLITTATILRCASHHALCFTYASECIPHISFMNYCSL